MFASSASRKGLTVLVTGSHGGSGKTTVAYLMPYVMAFVMKQAQSGKPVYLVEADYSNPKLAERLSLPMKKDVSAFADFLRAVRRNENGMGNLSAAEMQRKTSEVIQSITHEVPGTGLRIIACPYDTTSRDTRDIQDAIQKLTNALVSQEDCVVFLDGQTFAKDDIVDASLATTANHVVLVGNGRHIGDLHSFAGMLTKPIDQNGAGVSPANMSVFLNRTSERRALELKDEFAPLHVVGFLPRMTGIDDSTNDQSTAWVGEALRGDALKDTVTLVSQTLMRFLAEDTGTTEMIRTYATRDLLQQYDGDDFSSGGGRAERRKRGLFGRGK